MKRTNGTGFLPLLLIIGALILIAMGVAAANSGANQKRSDSAQELLLPTSPSSLIATPQPDPAPPNAGSRNPQSPALNTSVSPKNASFCALNPAYCIGSAINTQLLCETNPAYCGQYGLYPGLDYIPGQTDTLNAAQQRLYQEWWVRQQQLQQQQQQIQQQFLQQQQLQQQQLQQQQMQQLQQQLQQRQLLPQR